MVRLEPAGLAVTLYEPRGAPAGSLTSMEKVPNSDRLALWTTSFSPRASDAVTCSAMPLGVRSPLPSRSRRIPLTCTESPGR